MTTTIIKKNANLSIAGVRTRECVSPQDTLKGTSKAEAGKLHKERAGRKQLLLVFLRDNGHLRSTTIFPLAPPLWRLTSIPSHPSAHIHFLLIHCNEFIVPGTGLDSACLQGFTKQPAETAL